MQLTAYLSQLTKSTNILNDVSILCLSVSAGTYQPFQLVDKHIVFTASRENHPPSMPGRRHGRFGGGGRAGMGIGGMGGMFGMDFM